MNHFLKSHQISSYEETLCVVLNKKPIISMECSIPQNFPSKAAASDVKNIQPGQSPPKAMLHVNFDLENEEIHERKKKYLTAKYGQHQMSLIKKRLRVEMWMYDQLQVLYDSSEDSNSYEVEIDLDELLDIEAEPARRDWLRKKLVGVKQSEEAVEKFITELLQRATTL
ncbi:uncharacterized protein CDAR_510811 [Caerostris darwini]|uniref:Protein phosphatase 1 regulatory subunit 14B n=1 Tax=Caerostris darwini TaxID=1538125 RepID=A0AAV4TC32_9ARAC|nr:uncharacterized protein CDAR_510811 [Caerostris darwini]